MEVDLVGTVAVVAGDSSVLAEAISARLAINGAAVERIAGNEIADLETVVARHGQLDVLLHIRIDASGSSSSQTEQFLRATALAMRRPGGRIVSIASGFGVVAVRGESTASAAAAAIFSLTRSLALEFGADGIRINALALGAVGEEREARLVSHVPLARAGTPDEVGEAALFLVDPENSYMTGHVLTVDGGWAAGYARDF